MEKNIRAGIFLGFICLVLLAGTAFASTEAVDWGPDGWRLLGGTIACSLATLYTLSLLSGGRAALRFMACTLAIAWLAEGIGLQGNWLFGGAYRYHSAVQPVLPGGVPVFIPLAWFVLAGFSVMLLRGLKTTHPDGTRDARRILFKAAFSAVGVAAYDLALDPIAVSVGLWTWDQPGWYFGVPLMNFVGWWVVAFIIFLAGYGWTAIDHPHAHKISVRYDVVWGVAHVSLLTLLGLAVNNRTGCGQPVLLAIAAMSPLSLRWLSDVYWKVKSCRPVHLPI